MFVLAEPLVKIDPRSGAAQRPARRAFELADLDVVNRVNLPRRETRRVMSLVWPAWLVTRVEEQPAAAYAPASRPAVGAEPYLSKGACSRTLHCSKAACTNPFIDVYRIREGSS